ncbi:ribosome maturation factor RimM [Zeimonas arvi]|uniref:Ribosome maturation factor RimM n=1 Tax=Zeimonas arvi TaxID=2498847 RepID=A0A5C8NQS0_9BURK|nr:ribosome maturation factor RimM [Zeimonas arvi]TXL63486.1 16S rRNA processing protein RimM [Zeimonas arvi]
MTAGSSAAPARAGKVAPAGNGGGASPAAVVTVAALPADAVVVGRVEGAYGVRGAMRIEPFNDPRDSVLLKARRWYLTGPASRQKGPSGTDGPVAPGAAGRQASPSRFPVVVEVSRCRVHGAGLVATVSGIDVKESADALRGCEIAVSRADFPPPESGEYYWVDLVGCVVVTPDGVPLGVVEAVDDHGAHPLLRLRAEDGGARLIPFVDAHVPDVDVVGRRIVADWDPAF